MGDSSTIRDQALLLSKSERARLADELWLSLGICDDDTSDVEIAVQRSRELRRGSVQGLTHEEVMRSARKAIQ